MNKLGQIVLLAGKNGAGKSRLLNLIKFARKKNAELYEAKANYHSTLLSLNTQLTFFKRSIKNTKSQLRSTTDADMLSALKDKIASYDEEVQRINQSIDNLNRLIAQPLLLELDNGKARIHFIDYIPKNLKIEDPQTMPQGEWSKRTNSAAAVGINNVDKNAFAVLQQVAYQYFVATHQNYAQTPETKELAIRNYELLNSLIQQLLGTPMTLDADGHCTIFGYKLGQSRISDGQCVLLQLAVALYLQGRNINNNILFMDEPENHLHPSSIVDIIDKIIKLSSDGQIWIATHSIPLLSHFDPSAIWYVEDGLVQYGGKTPEKVLESLLGDQERIQKLRDFSDLPSKLATNRFAFECLLPPGVAMTDAEDPQVKQMRELLERLRNDKGCIRLLDFGAGKGRMIANLSEHDTSLFDTIDYFALDDSDEDKTACLQSISQSYPDADRRYHNGFESLRCVCDDGTFDVVVMCNVLHEIPTAEWNDIFKNIRKLLNDDGYLLLIEDCRIPVGELPHQKGFIVLNTLHLKKLLDIPETEKRFVFHDARATNPSQCKRLMAHLIPSAYLENLSNATINDALQELKSTAITQIKHLRNQPATYGNGVEHAFWTQQLANSELSLK